MIVVDVQNDFVSPNGPVSYEIESEIRSGHPKAVKTTTNHGGHF